MLQSWRGGAEAPVDARLVLGPLSGRPVRTVRPVSPVHRPAAVPSWTHRGKADRNDPQTLPPSGAQASSEEHVMTDDFGPWDD